MARRPGSFERRRMILTRNHAKIIALLFPLLASSVGVLSNQEQQKPAPGTPQAAEAPKIAVMAAPPGSQENPPGAQTPDRLLEAGHTNGIYALAFSRDGRWLASGSEDKNIVLWNTTTGEEVRKLKGHSAAVTQLAFSPDGKRLVSGDQKGGVKLWDFEAGRVVYSTSLHGWVKFLAYSADGQVWAASVDPQAEAAMSRIEIHDAATGKIVRTIPTDWYAINGITALALVPDGLLVGSGALSPDDGADGSVHVWNLASGQLLKTYPGMARAFSADGRWMARVYPGDESKVTFVDLASGQEKQTILVRHSTHISFSPDGRQIATTGDIASELTLWSVDTGKEIETLPADKSYGSYGLLAVAFSPDGKVVAAAAYSGFAIKIWDVAAARLQRTLHGQSVVLGIAVSPDGRWLAAGSQEELSVWDLAAGKRIVTPYDGPVSRVAFSRDGRWLAANPGLQFAGETLKVWDTKSWTLVGDFKFEGTGQPVASIVFAERRFPLASVGPFTRAWEFAAEGQTQSVWSGMSSLAISPEGKFLATQKVGTGSVELWDLASGQKLPILPVLPAHRIYLTILAFSPDGRSLLTGGVETQMPGPPGVFHPPTAEFAIKVWDVATWKVQKAFSFVSSQAVAAAFSPSGQVLVIEKDWNQVDLLDVDSGTTLATLTARESRAQIKPYSTHSVAFSPDGALFFQAGSNGIRVWKLKPPETNNASVH